MKIIENPEKLSSNRWIPRLIGVIVNQYKRICTIHARKINNGFAWQRNYHDHIIRNDREFQMIRDYVWDNPASWEKDKFNSFLRPARFLKPGRSSIK